MSTNLADLVSTFTDQVQDLEDALYGLILGRALGWATGPALDKIGDQVGRDRPVGATDDEYRALIYSQIVVNTSHGMTETVYQLMRLLGGSGLRIREPGNYSLLLQYTGTLLLGDDDLLAVLEAATPPVTLQVTEYTTGFFGFSGHAGAFGFGVGKLARSVE